MTARLLVVAASFGRAKHMERVLVHASCEVAVSTRPEDACAIARDGLCDVILIDSIGAPDAFSLCRTLKADPATALTPVAIVTRECEPAERLRALDAGADEGLCFPSSDADLVARVRSLAEARRLTDAFRGSAALRGVPGDLASRTSAGRVLVLDPEDRSRERLVGLLSPEFVPHPETSPAQALIHAAKGAFEVAVVSQEWLDADGPKLCRQLRLVDPLQSLRVILLTHAEDLPLRLWAGSADDVLRRPVDRCEALMRVRTALRKYDLGTAIRELGRVVVHPGAPRMSTFRPPDRFAA